jgi:hypothetical protein|tara:strand:+ start:390 stop:545 length:156 start_codon:yes stop_codon:yes gene_type:complete
MLNRRELTLRERTFLRTILEKYIADNNIQSELPAKAVWLNKLMNKLRYYVK